MNKKLKEFFSAMGLIAAAVVMMAVAIGAIYLITNLFHTNSK